MRVLVVGGAGYLGSHVVRECRRQGLEPVVFDSLTAGHRASVEGTEQILGSVLEPRTVRSAFESFALDGVVQLAGTASSTAAMADLARHYQCEVGGTLNVIQAMLDAKVRHLIYASSVQVYGEPDEVPISEEVPAEAKSPIGLAKLWAERLIAEVAASQPIQYTVLRFFNIGGADAAGGIGEAHRTETHLIPRLFLSALGREHRFTLHGADYDTPDGSCIRDFVHVSDCARAVIRALARNGERGNQTYNIGSGEGYSVLEVVAEAQKLARLPIAVTRGPRRPWEPAALVASIDKARALLDWEPESSSLATILETSWEWHRRHPNGYEAATHELAAEESETAELFGDIAVRLGFVTSFDVVRALERQKREMEEGNQHKLIGMHMLEMGLLSTSQLIEILKYYEKK